jgi:hypothetical protein
MLRYLALCTVCLLWAAPPLRASEFDAEFGTAMPPDGSVSRRADDAKTAVAASATELDRESPGQSCHWGWGRGFGFGGWGMGMGMGYGGFGYPGFGWGRMGYGGMGMGMGYGGMGMGMGYGGFMPVGYYGMGMGYGGGMFW